MVPQKSSVQVPFEAEKILSGTKCYFLNDKFTKFFHGYKLREMAILGIWSHKNRKNVKNKDKKSSIPSISATLDIFI